ncbi:MAG TPA: hypothetical protein PK629_03170 [Oscillospiraceae bacterium]|nr:hypothetical protein [Oscillospiraceae bacterium]HPF55490.1 hypothetical protein [Clostridiales bacterium]HPK34788.1 hypothetical protein [Oscillospiraceae bacterium]HPR75838.1 hypothetical protein [Oscillospiraceae bacterium]
MSGWELWLILVLAALGICCVVNAVLLQITYRSPKNREIELLLTGDNAECLLRSTLQASRGSFTKIIAVCEDEEAEKICEIFCRCHPNIICRRLSDDT